MALFLPFTLLWQIRVGELCVTCMSNQRIMETDKVVVKPDSSNNMHNYDTRIPKAMVERTVVMQEEIRA